MEGGGRAGGAAREGCVDGGLAVVAKLALGVVKDDCIGLDILTWAFLSICDGPREKQGHLKPSKRYEGYLMGRESCEIGTDKSR